jgi:hypothetical protein
MTLQALTHHNSPYSDDYVNAKGNVGLEEGFQTHKRGLGNKHGSASRLANAMISRLQDKMVEAEGLGITDPGKYPQHELDAMIRKAKRNGTKTK